MNIKFRLSPGDQAGSMWNRHGLDPQREIQANQNEVKLDAGDEIYIFLSNS